MKTSSSYASAEALVFHFTVAVPGWDDEILLEKLDFCPTPNNLENNIHMEKELKN